MTDTVIKNRIARAIAAWDFAYAAEGYEDVAGSGEMAEMKDVGKYGMVPIYGKSIKSGEYEAEMESSSSFFSIYSCDLTVKGNKMTAVNCRTRGLRVFLRFCAKREYMEAVTIPMMKVDETFKDPYTDDELQKLLKRPATESFVEWRCWAAVNTFLATGIRAMRQ